MNRKGQSLVELIAALGVLTVGFLGIVTLLSRSFFLSRVTADEITGTYLASEGIEITKNLIDHDVYASLASPPVGSGWGSCFGGGGGDFEFDYTTTNCPPGIYSGTHLRFDPATHRYGYGSSGGSTITGFTREIRISVPSATEIVVNSIVRWSTGPLASQSINLEDHFYHWHP